MTAELGPGHRLALGPDGPARVGVRVSWRQPRSLTRLVRRRRPPFDLDAYCLLVDAGGELVGRVGYRQPAGLAGAVRHLGADAGGAGADPGERLSADLSAVPPEVTALVVAVTTFPGQTFDRLSALTCRIVDDDTSIEIAHSELPARGRHTLQWVVALTRAPDPGDTDRGSEDDTGESGSDADPGWVVVALGETGSGRTFTDLLPLLDARP